MKFILYSFIAAVALILLSAPINAQEKEAGDYVIYYNAFNSSFIQPNVAKSYNLPRSGTTGILNVSIHKKNDQHRPDAISVNIQGRAKNNLSQIEELAFREIKEEQAIYYLADFQFRNQEEIDLSFVIRIPGMQQPIELSLSQKLYKD